MLRSKRRLDLISLSDEEQPAKVSRKDKSKNLPLFERVVNEAGFKLSKAEKSPFHQLSVDQAVFQHKLEKLLNQKTEQFLESLKSYLEDPKHLHGCLMPTVTSEDCLSARGGNQDSLIRLLLGIEALQVPLSNFLLEKIIEFGPDSELSHAIMTEGTETSSFPRLILSQFRWLDKIVDSKELTQKMMEILTVAPLGVQKDIILSFPDIINDSEHLEVAKQLSTLLNENQDLSICILDTLSNLNIPLDSIADIHENVMKSLPTVNMEDLPVMVKFILENVGQQDAVVTITDLRDNLHLTRTIPPVASSTPCQQGALSKERGSEFLTIDAIRTTMRFNKFIADSWIKVIEACKQPGDQKVVDFVVLLVLHSLGNHKKAVESLIRNKIRAGLLTESKLQLAFGSHAAILREYFPTLLCLSESLLRSFEPAILSIASSLYELSFVHFDTYYQQEVIGSLITHLGSGSVHEMDASIDTLEVLAKKHTSKMARFGTFIKCILDYLDNLKLVQIRKVYFILCHLAYCGGPEGAMLQDDLHIIIRKQLTNGNPKYQRMGVIGALMASKVMSQCSVLSVDTTALSSTSSQGSTLSEIQQQAIELLELVRSSTVHSPEAMALFCEELARVVMKRELDDRIEAWIENFVINDFQDNFVIDLEPNKELSDQIVQMDFQFNLDGNTADGIAVNLLPLIMKEESQKHMGVKTTSEDTKWVSPIVMCPFFRLLWNCEKAQHDGNLEEIDALLGCPVCMPSSQVLEKYATLPPEEKAAVVTSLFHCINWFRELLNAFASTKDAEMKVKVVHRLKDIIALMENLKKCLASVEPMNYQPPKANFDVEIVGPDLASPSNNTKSAGRKRGKKTKATKDSSKKDNASKTQKISTSQSSLTSQVPGTSRGTQHAAGDATIQDPFNEDELDDDESSKSLPSSESVNLHNYKHFFRELDLDVFGLFEIPLDLNADEDSEDLLEEKKVLKLNPAEVHLLLDDLTKKLDFALLSSGSSSKRLSFLKPKGDKRVGHSTLSMYSEEDIISKMMSLMPHLCKYLEDIDNHFQVIIKRYDGIMDSSEMLSDQSAAIGSCMQQIFTVINSILSWKGFDGRVHLDLLKQVLSVMTSQTESSSQTTIQELVGSAFEYVMRFSNVASIENAACLMHLLKTIYRFEAEDASLRSRLGTLAEDFLKRDWGIDMEDIKKQRKQLNDRVEVFVRMYITHSSDVFVPLNELTTVIVPELMEAEGKDVKSSTFPTLNKYTFSMFYRVMLSQLVEAAKDISSSRMGRSQFRLDQLQRWSSIIGLFQVQVNFIKVFSSKSNLTACLKYGRQFVDQFLRTGMPLLDKLFRGHTDLIQALLKKLQMSTRFLQHVCSHSKVAKDVVLINQVPFLKKTLEMLVYRVKAMLALNNYEEAFWIGNLKNRDLHGEEILSQSVCEESDDDDEQAEDENAQNQQSDQSDVELDDEGGE